jgi:hypothetical protein
MSSEGVVGGKREERKEREERKRREYNYTFQSISITL